MALIDSVLVDSVVPAKTTVRSYHAAREYYSSHDATFGVPGTLACVQAGLNQAATDRREFVLQGGEYLFGAGTLTIPSNSRIRTNGYVNIVRSVNTNVPVLYANAAVNIRIDGGITITHTGTGDSASATAAGLYFDSCINTGIDDLVVIGKFYVGICMASCENWALRRPQTRGVQNRGIYPYLSCRHGEIIAPHVDGREAGGTTPVTTYGINYNAGGSSRYIENVQVNGGQVHHCTHQGVEFGDQVWGCGATGTSVSDITQFHGFLVQKANGTSAANVRLAGVSAKSCGQYGILISESFYVAVSGANVVGCGLDGLCLSASEWCSIGQVTSNNNTQSGVSVINASANNSLLGGTLAVNNTGLSLTSGTNDNYYSGFVAKTNTAAQITDAGTNTAGTNITA